MSEIHEHRFKRHRDEHLVLYDQNTHRNRPSGEMSSLTDHPEARIHGIGRSLKVKARIFHEMIGRTQLDPII
jgi:hypothetical protein